MPPPPPQMMPPSFISQISVELAYTIIAVVLCFAVYLKTKEIYDLTKYNGLKYFRQAFLFFGLSNLLRFFIIVFMSISIAFDVVLPRLMIPPFFIMLTGYLSTMAILYLIYSSAWEHFDRTRHQIIAHMLAVTLALLSFFTRSHVTLLLLQSILLIAALILNFSARSSHMKITQTRILNILICILWLLNLFFIDSRHAPFQIDIAIRAVSLIIFVVIYHKVSKFAK
ncbi:MAG: hypothetical protein HGA85_03060 [Nanoarchaeota archaeon]|nr:hypothetical protein [Nanoarchaeota archaeon]